MAGALQRPAADYPTEPLYLDLHFPAGGARFSQPLPAGHNAFVYVYRGSLDILDPQGQATPVPVQRMAILANDGDGVMLQAAAGAAPARALLIAGRPLREPIAQYGPFVMNTREQLIEAVEDFQNGRLG